MKKMLALLVLALPLTAQEGFDFKTLDKLGANSRNHTEITLDADMLRLAAGMFSGGGKDADSIKPLIDSLKGVYIRSFKFDRDGQYNETDLEPLRAYLKQTHWNRIVESHEDREVSEVYLQPLSNSQLGGVAIIAAEAREVTIVYISGNLKAEDIQKLSGTMGIPDIKLELDGKKTPAKPDKGKKEDEE
jgi:hypothetical protein